MNEYAVHEMLDGSVEFRGVISARLDEPNIR